MPLRKLNVCLGSRFEQNTIEFYEHEDFRLRKHVINKIETVFYRSDVIQRKNANNEAFRIETLRYVWRCLSKFPIEVI